MLHAIQAVSPNFGWQGALCTTGHGEKRKRPMGAQRIEMPRSRLEAHLSTPVAFAVSVSHPRHMGSDNSTLLVSLSAQKEATGTECLSCGGETYTRSADGCQALQGGHTSSNMLIRLQRARETPQPAFARMGFAVAEDAKNIDGT